MKSALSKLVLCVAMVGIGACRNAAHQTEDHSNVFPARAAALLRKAETIKVLSLDPFKSAADPKGFHDWSVVGTVPVAAKEREALVNAIVAGVAPSNWPIASCFNPRHGVHAIAKEGILDLVICFECNQVEVFYSGGGRDFYMPGYTLEAPLSRIITKAGIAIVPSMSDRTMR